MTHARLLGTFALALGLVAAQPPTEDPVLKIKAQRAQAGTDGDLPPVPRTVLEPPPLPPPEIHVKDTKGYKAKRGRKGKSKAPQGTVRKGKAAKKAGSRKK